MRGPNTDVFLAQTDIKDPTAEPSTDDFLAREKALLGDDADQFATNDDDLLGGAGNNEQSTFESQFPDLTNPEAVSCLPRHVELRS